MEEKGSITDWSLVNGHGYMLNRNRKHAAASRLNLQFYLWRDALKFNIHPSILPLLPKTAAIADVASGSGIWLIDVSRQLPESQLDGLDYDLDQAPSKEWLPPNVKTRYLNIFEDIPADLVGKYDYVHTRLLVLVVESKNPRPIIRNLHRLLKPGGYLQWDEIDTVNMSVKKVDPNPQAPALEQLRDWSRAEGRHEWTVRLPQFFIEEGFHDATIDFFGDRPELARAFNDQHLLTVEEFAEGLAKLGKPEAASNYFGLVEKAYNESVAGAALCVPRIVCVARKPL
ncbi:methyltransferase [Hirsutella rhossiliensis]|uniref:Methyltransferase domain-containing protein n=1 Tax=Hirsutella rhossiliensis TaxID=111463 RepID=A0A9P8N140_9HYPO|nr:methyltransferase domain-containing protein [Hirsutella rhossiliensis]KAH0964016.1 methyltransferase domain-containing protein [Hirsutella rhossiliensis]